MLDEDLSDEAEFTVDVDEAEYNEADDADLHLNKLVKRKILQCNRRQNSKKINKQTNKGEKVKYIGSTD